MTITDPKQYRDNNARFIFDRYEVNLDGNDSYIYYYYALYFGNEHVNFMHTIKLQNIQIDMSNELIENIVFNLGIMEMINYYKLISPKSITINCGSISHEQTKFWQKLYYLGLGEYRYLNDFCMDVMQEDFVRFSCQSPVGYQRQSIDTSGNIIPLGGGKDSSTVLGLLADVVESTKCLMVDTSQAALDCASVAGYSDQDILLVNRVFDKQMIDMNSEGFLNGHIPYSAILAFISLLVSATLGKKYIILANESSANEATVIGTDINHQYSKTLEFERDFDAYVGKFITEDIVYFSLLRPWSELQIARKFATMPKFHNAFLSCNKGLKQNKWCTKCAKCLFVYIILSPFIAQERLELIFGSNMLDDSTLESIFLELLGVGDVKPFDCVGTIDEVAYSLNTLSIMYDMDKMPYLLKLYVSGHQSNYQESDKLLESSDEHNVPSEFLSYLDEE